MGVSPTPVCPAITTEAELFRMAGNKNWCVKTHEIFHFQEDFYKNKSFILLLMSFVCRLYLFCNQTVNFFSLALVAFLLHSIHLKQKKVNVKLFFIVLPSPDQTPHNSSLPGQAREGQAGPRA